MLFVLCPQSLDSIELKTVSDIYNRNYIQSLHLFFMVLVVLSSIHEEVNRVSINSSCNRVKHFHEAIMSY